MEDDIFEYNEDEALALAEAMQKKAEQEAEAAGKNAGEKYVCGQKAFNETIYHHAVSFLQKFQERLDSLSNQSIAKLLLVLVSLGLNIEDEEELEYWINLLEQQSFRRIAVYFEIRNGRDAGGRLKPSRLPESELLANISRYSSEDIDGLRLMAVGIQENLRRRNPNILQTDEKINFFKQIENFLSKDARLKKTAEQNRPRRRMPRREQTVDTLSLLQNKMRAAGVIEGGDYWNSVIAEHNMATDKEEFTRTWVKDENRSRQDNQKINELRGLTEEEQNKKVYPEEILNKSVRQKEDGNVYREQNDDSLKEKERQKDAAEQLIKDEFSNEQNQKAAAKQAEKLNRPLNSDDIKIMKIKAISGKQH